MNLRFLRPIGLSVLLLLAGCAGKHVQQGDSLAKKGQWEEALAEYRQAAEISGTNRNLNRVKKAEREVAKVFVARGLEARDGGRMPEAGDLWKRAAQLRPKDTKPGSALSVIGENAAKLETCADEAVTAKRWEDSFKCFAALQLAFPERSDLAARNEQAHRAFASELDEQAQALAKKGLPAAALVIELRALHHDPLHPAAYQHAEELRKQVHAGSLIAINSVAVEDQGWTPVAASVGPKLNMRLGEHPPYGPTKNPKAMPGSFVVVVEDFAWWDERVHGVTKKEIEGAAAEKPKEKIPSPAHAAQAAVVAALDRELKEMWLAAAAADEQKDAKKKKDDKKAARKPLTARAPTAEGLAKKRDELEAAKQKLATISETEAAETGATYWMLPWTDVTRVVEARVRFEVREPDFPAPVVKTATLRVETKDRTHEGSAERNVKADALDLPTLEQMLGDLGDKATVDGLAALREARDRRAERWIELGRTAKSRGADDEALDAFVRALFARGSDDLPGDAAIVVAARLEHGKFKDVTAGK